jgi:putative flavoprotein involved in K+ transport
MTPDHHVESVVVGGGQAGLAVGYHLRQRHLPFLILDQNERVGDVWRHRWDSLRLFTPARYDSLPGLPFPAPNSAYPGKDAVADYLEEYVRHFELPVRTGVAVESLTRAGAVFELTTSEGRFTAGSVVVATGAYHHPRIPEFAIELDDTIVQLHSSEYRNRSQLQDGPVLVVGAGNSGAEIALDLAPDHHVWLSGPDTGQEPTRAGSVPDRLLTPLYWLAATRLTVDKSMGRKLRDRFVDPPRGIPLGRVRYQDLPAAGVERVGRTIGVSEGSPQLEDGKVLEPSNVIWCTGFVDDFDWIDIELPSQYGIPVHDRGVVTACPGLYLVGLRFLYSLSSALLGGVGRDAEHIVDHIGSLKEKQGTPADETGLRAR